MSARSSAGLLTALALAFGLAACGSPSTSDSSPATVSSFITLAGHGVDLDYEPLQGPQDATGRADLIVVGRLTGVADGISIRYQDPMLTARRRDTYATFVIAVDRVLKGDPRLVTDGKVYVMAPKNTAVSVGQLNASVPQARAVMVLDDITDWTPLATATVQRPATLPAKAPIFHPYADGFWLQGSADAEMAGLFATPSELRPGWAGARTIDQFTAQLG